MKILFLSSDLNAVGGIQKYNRGVIEVFREHGEKLSIVEYRGNFLFVKLFFIARVLWRWLWFRPDFIFCGHINFSPICLLLNKVFCQSYIIATHGVEVWRIESGLKRKALVRAFKILVVSRFTKRKIIEQFPEVGERIFFLPNFVDGDIFIIGEKNKVLLDRHNLSSDDFILLTVNRFSSLEKQKGYDKVIKALPQVRRDVPDVKFLLVGEGDDLPRVKELVHSLHLDDCVVFAGKVSDGELVDYYNLCDLFVMPSKSEGFGIVFVEALACGKPVIAGDTDASSETLLDGEVGVLIDPDDVASIAEAIVRFVRKEIPSRLTNGSFLRKKILDVFGFDEFKKRVKILLQEL